MTVTATHNEISYTASAGATVFPYTFLILAAADLLVYKDTVLQASGYTVSSVGVGSGGNVTFTTPLVGGEIVRLLRSTEITQEVDLLEGSRLPADATEGMWDKLTLIAQDLDGRVDTVETDITNIVIGATNLVESTVADLPAAGTSGALRHVTDDVRGIWMDSGTRWFPTNAGMLNTEEFDGADLGERFNAAVAALPATGGMIVIPPGDYTTTTELSFAGTTAPFNGAFQPVSVWAYGVTIRTTGAISGLRICGGHKAVYGLEVIHEGNADALYGINIDGSNRNAHLRDVVIRANASCRAEYAAIRIGFRTDVLPHVPSYMTIIEDAFIRADGGGGNMPHIILVEGASNVVTCRGGFYASATIGIRFRPMAGGIDAQELGSPGSIVIDGVDFEGVETCIQFDDIDTHLLPGGTRIVNCAVDSPAPCTFLSVDPAILYSSQGFYLAGNRLQVGVTTYIDCATTFHYTSLDGEHTMVDANRLIGGLSLGVRGSVGNVYLERDDAHILAQRDLANPQTSKVYNTTDATLVDREYFETTWSGNILYLRNWATGTGTLRELRIANGSTQGQALGVYPTLDEGIRLSGFTNSASNLAAGRVTIGRSSVTSATSGTSATLRLVENFSPTATSTMVARPLHVAPVIDYSAGTPGAGWYEAIRISVTETALPTGTSYMIRASGGAAGTTDVWSVTNTGASLAGDGTVALPSISFVNDPNTGFHSAAADVIGVSVGGVRRMAMGATLALSSATPLAWSSTTDATGTVDLKLERGAANVLSQVNGASGQGFRLYNTTDGTNSEYLGVAWSGNVCILRVDKTGTGSTREIAIRPGDGVGLGVRVMTTLNGGVGLGGGAATTANSSARVNIGGGSANSSTSGNSLGLTIQETFNPTATSTMVAIPLQINPTINYSNGTPGAGAYEAIRISVAETALPTGTSYMIRAMGGAGATHVFSVTNTGNVATVGSIKSSSATAGLGYGTGAGGVVTQGTSKATGVTLDKASGQITMHNATLNAATSVGFTLTNAAIATTDVVVVSIDAGATADSYTVGVDAVGAGTCRIHLRNVSAGNLGEAVVLNFAVIKAVAA